MYASDQQPFRARKAPPMIKFFQKCINFDAQLKFECKDPGVLYFSEGTRELEG